MLVNSLVEWMIKMKKWVKVLISFLVVILLLAVSGEIYLKVNTYQGTSAAVTASQVSQENKQYYYFPAAKKSKLTIIFYQGALVEADSYSIWAKKVAAAGYNVYLLKLPLNLAVLGEGKAAEIIKAQPNNTYILAGHSLGGVMASRFAHQNSQVAGMIYLASYPDEKGRISNLPVLSITGSRDGVLNQKSYQQAKKYLPQATTYETITGGNHAGFGSYGKQKGDNSATISNLQQQNLVAKKIIKWLKVNF